MGEKKELNAIIGENIKRERERAGLTQETFSEMIGIGPKSLSAIERGASGVSLSTLRKMCDSLSVTSDCLIYGEISKNDVEILSERFARMSPKQFAIANDMVACLLRTFAINEPVEKPEGTD